MCKFVGQWGRISPNLLFAVTLITFSTVVSSGQIKPMMACGDANGGPTPTITSISPSTWVAGNTYNVVVTGNFTGNSTLPGCTYDEITLLDSKGKELFYLYGDNAMYDGNHFIKLSHGVYLGPTQIEFTVKVAEGVPSVTDYLRLTCDGCDYRPEAPVQIVGPLSIASIAPGAWFAGRSYDITITGAGFLTASDPGGPTQLTIKEDSGKVDLSNVNVVNATQITATVIPSEDSPAGLATVKVTKPR